MATATSPAPSAHTTMAAARIRVHRGRVRLALFQVAVGKAVGSESGEFADPGGACGVWSFTFAPDPSVAVPAGAATARRSSSGHEIVVDVVYRGVQTSILGRRHAQDER